MVTANAPASLQLSALAAHGRRLATRGATIIITTTGTTRPVRSVVFA